MPKTSLLSAPNLTVAAGLHAPATSVAEPALVAARAAFVVVRRLADDVRLAGLRPAPRPPAPLLETLAHRAPSTTTGPA